MPDVTQSDEDKQLVVFLETVVAWVWGWDLKVGRYGAVGGVSCEG